MPAHRTLRPNPPKRLVKLIVDLGSGEEEEMTPVKEKTDRTVKGKDKMSQENKVPEAPDQKTDGEVSPVESQKLDSELEIATPAPIKRKRGRPRKYPVDESGKRIKFQAPAAAAASPAPSEPSLSEIVFPVTPHPQTGITERIPRPPNAFMIFGKENRRRLSLRHPSSTNKQISRILGEEWRSMHEDEKSEYKAKARKAMEEHRTKHPNYKFVRSESKLAKPVKSSSATKPVQKDHATAKEAPNSSPAVDESNKENIPPESMEPQPVNVQPEIAPPEPSPARVITELFVAPPGYENVEIMGLDKFVLWEDKLIPYKEWVGAEGDVKRLSGNYTRVPEQLLQPITNCVIAGTRLEDQSAGQSGQEWTKELRQEMTLHQCNSAPSSPEKTLVDQQARFGDGMDAQSLLNDLMSGGNVSAAQTSAAVVVQNEPQSGSLGMDARSRLFWNNDESVDSSSDEE